MSYRKVCIQAPPLQAPHCGYIKYLWSICNCKILHMGTTCTRSVSHEEDTPCSSIWSILHGGHARHTGITHATTAGKSHTHAIGTRWYHTPAINEGCARSVRISHTSRRAPLQPVILSQAPCTPYHPPNRTGVVLYAPNECADTVGLQTMTWLIPILQGG